MKFEDYPSSASKSSSDIHKVAKHVAIDV